MLIGDFAVTIDKKIDFMYFYNFLFHFGTEELRFYKDL
jgi:hypothetical protein